MIYGSELSSSVISRLKKYGIKLETEDSGALLVYRRKGGFPEGPVEKIINSSRSLSLHPVHSVQPEVSTTLLLRLSKPMVVAPASSVTVYVKAPISAGLYVIEGSAQKLVDYFSPSPYKYALYGSAANGKICRFYRTDAYSEVPTKDLDIWEAATKITIENDSRKFVEVKNLLYPLLNTDIYLDSEGRAYIESANLHISFDGVGTISLENMPPMSGLKECPHQFEKLQKTVRLLMEFGF
ncbi:MAG: DUF432 domain-containing protein [Candidatus Methanomethylicaceae archaeon]